MDPDYHMEWQPCIECQVEGKEENGMNRICSLLKIQYPILQGGMAWVGTPNLASAVSNAGGLGIIGSGSMTPDILQKAIQRCKALTTFPFGVNLILVSPFIDEQVEVVLKEQPPIVTFGAGNPSRYISRLKEKEIKVIPVVASEGMARMMERINADAVIAEGMESGGHIGEVSTMVLVPRIVDQVSIPVIAAGGIVDGRGMAAAFILGAEGVQMGTRFIASFESEAHEIYKKKILRGSIRDTEITGLKMGHPARVLRSKICKTLADMENIGSLAEAEDLLVGSLRKAFMDGDLEEGSFMAGQCCGLIDEIKTVQGIIESTWLLGMKRFQECYQKFSHPENKEKKEKKE